MIVTAIVAPAGDVQVRVDVLADHSAPAVAESVHADACAAVAGVAAALRLRHPQRQARRAKHSPDHSHD